MASVLTAVGVAILAGLSLAIVVTLTWLTFPVANVIRSLGSGGHSRWVRQALGRGTAIRDLGELCEAEATIDGVWIRISWSGTTTRVVARPPSGPPAVSPTTLQILNRVGDTEIRDELTWRASRPPDPQLVRIISQITTALAR